MPLGSITESHFDKSFDINVKGLLFTVQKALSLFQDGGSIILTSSVRASKVFEGVKVYSATKAAVRPNSIEKKVIEPNFMWCERHMVIEDGKDATRNANFSYGHIPDAWSNLPSLTIEQQSIK